MVRKPVLYGSFATLLMAAACQEAPVDPSSAPGPGGAGRGLLGRIVAKSAELGLTADQVAKLTAIGEQLQAKNAALQEQLKAILGDRPERGAMRELSAEEREALRAKMEQARPILEQLRENSRAAFEEARAILTAEQQAKIREHTRRGPGQGAGMRRGPGGPGDPLARLLARGSELGLSQEQTAAITSIQASLRTKNAALQEQLKAILGDRPERGAMRELSAEEREALRAKMEQARPILEQLRENSRAAFEEARAVLTAE